MEVGIIEAGEPPPSLTAKHGTYDAMTRRLLGDSHHFRTYRAFESGMPSAEACEAFIITGSACSVYDSAPWIVELKTFLRSIQKHVRLVGICFGHQIMAEAYGGRVEKASRGWGLGLHRYEICKRGPWMDDDVEAIRATASHQDQIVAMPPDAEILAASAFTPFAILSYQDRLAISMQFHPEFDPAYSRALFALRRAPDLTQTVIAEAITSMYQPNDNDRVARWINAFLAGG